MVFSKEWKKMADSIKSEATSRTLEHGLDVLMCFLKDHRELSLTEIARTVGRNTTSTYRLIQTLAEKGFLSRNPENRKYFPGMTVKMLGELVDDKEELRLAAHPYLVKAHREFNENVSVYIYHNFKRLCIDRIESTHPLRQTVLVGEELPLTLGGGGTALLAFLPPKVQAAVMKSEPGISPEKLREIREKGYAVSYDEMGQGSVGIGVPIFDKHGQVLAALNLSGPTNRLTGDVVTRGVARLREIAAQVTAELS